MTRANRCFNDLQEDYLKGNWQARELEEYVSAYKVHTHLDLYHDYDVPIYSYIHIEVEIYVEVNMDMKSWIHKCIYHLSGHPRTETKKQYFIYICVDIHDTYKLI